MKNNYKNNCEKNIKKKSRKTKGKKKETFQLKKIGKNVLVVFL